MALPFISPSGAAVLLIAYLTYRLLTVNKIQRGRLPPGPWPLPVIGNARDFPSSDALMHEHWLRLKEKYGPMIYLTAMGMNFLILQDTRAAIDLLENRSIKTSSRPGTLFVNELCGYGGSIIQKNYGHEFRLRRKLMHQVIGTKVLTAQFSGLQEQEVHRQLVQTLKDPKKLLRHYKR